MSAALQAAAKSPDCQPFVEVTVSDQPCERPRLDLEECYTGAAYDATVAAVVSKRGTIVRIRISSAGRWECNRVTDPAQASSWDVWTSLGGSGWVPGSWLALASDSMTGRLWAAGALPTSGTVYYRYSTDDGVTWSPFATAFVRSGSPCRGVALWAQGGTVWLCSGVDNGGGGGSDGSLVMSQRIGDGAWTVVGETAQTYGLIDGVSMDVTSAGTLWCMFGQGGKLWGEEFDRFSVAFVSAGDVLALADGGPVTAGKPFYRRLADVGRAVMTYVEVSTVPAYARPVVCFSPVRWWLTEEVPWRFESAYGLAVLRTGGYWYFVQSDRAWRAKEYTGAEGELVSFPEERIAALRLVEEIDGSAELEVAVDNSGGWYDGAGESGPARCMRPGAQVAVKLGYWTSAGGEGVYRQPFWVTAVGLALDAERGGCWLVVRARGAFGELRSLKARHAYEWGNLDLGGIVQRAWWRVCGRAEAPVHGDLALAVPYFHVPAGESWGDAVARLLAMTGTYIRFYNAAADGLGWAAAYPEVNSLGTGDAVWSFGGDAPPARSACYWRQGADTQRVEVFGAGCYGQYADYPGAVWAAWRDTPHRVTDLKLDAQAEVDDRARQVWRSVGRGQVAGEVRARVVPGLEIGDVVEVTEARAGLVAAARQVVRLETVLDRRKGLYEQAVELGGLT